MLLSSQTTQEALTYHEEIRDQAIGLAESLTWFSARTYLWFLIGILALIAFHVAIAGILPTNLQFVPFAFGLMSLAVFVPILMTRRLLIVRREDILRIIRGGFNGPDKDQPPDSQ